MIVSTHRPSRSAVYFSLFLAAVALPRLAAAVSCGDVLTQDTVLDTDLTCVGDGLVAGADGITIDLGGHAIRGPGTDQPGFGVTVDGRSGITVQNGRLLDYGVAVLVRQSADTVLDHLTIQSASTAVGVLASSGIRLSRCAISDTPTGQGIYADTVSSFDVVGNVFTRAATTFSSVDDLVVATNLSVASPHGIAIGLGSRIRIEGNVVYQPARVGISVPYASDVAVTANVVSGGSDDGIVVEEWATNVALTGNAATRNARDGIRVLSPSTTLTRNLATKNGQLGIEAVAGVADGGGNVAFGNGDRRQCVGVRCRPR